MKTFITRQVKIKIILFFIAANIMQSCSEDDPGPKEVLLTVKIDPGYFSTGIDSWLFISDKNLNPIDVRNAKDSIEVKLKGTDHNTISLTIFTHHASASNTNGSEWNSFGFTSYQEIPSGTILHLTVGKSPLVEVPNVIGSAPFVLQNYLDSDKPEESFVFSDGVSTPYSVLDYNTLDYTGSNFSSNFILREDPSKILATTYLDNKPVYLWLNSVKPGENVTVNFNDFIPCKIIPVDKQISIGTIKTMTGTNFATGYIFCDIYSRQLSKSSNLSTLPNLGYLDGFEKYFISVVQNPLHEQNNLYYTKAGDLPSSISLPEYSYSINNDELTNVNITFNSNYSYKEAYFLKSNSEIQVYWSVNSSNNEDFKTPMIPGELVKKYPMLNINDLNLQFVAFTNNLDGYSYQDFMQDNFHDAREVYETLRYVIKP